MDSTATVAANIQGAIVAWRCHGHKPGTIRGPPADLPKASHGSIWILLGWTGTGWLQALPGLASPESSSDRSFYILSCYRDITPGLRSASECYCSAINSVMNKTANRIPNAG
ncbi:hypothetical protein V2G26_004403 [Clonostachys chloroleuca]